MTTLQVQVPSEALISLKLDETDFAQELTRLAAIKLFELGRLSAGRSAQLAGISKVEFLAMIHRYDVGPCDFMTLEDLRQDVLNAAG